MENGCIAGEPSFSRRITPLSVSVFLEVFIDASLFLSALNDSVLFPQNTAVYVCFLLPYVLFQLPGGYLADHLPKRFLLILCRIFEFLVFLAGISVLKFGANPLWVAPVLLALISFKAAFYQSALFGILPETFRENELSIANGHIGVVFFLAIAASAPTEAFFSMLTKGNPVHGLAITAFCSAIGLVAAFRIYPSVSAIQRKKELAYPWRKSLSAGFGEMFRTPALLLAAMGDGFFLAIGLALLYLIGAIMLQKVAGGGGTGMRLTLMAPPVGMALGCWLAGRLSRKKIELGLIPFGAFGVAFSLPFAAFFHGAPAIFTVTIPRLYSDTVQLYPPALVFLFLAGLSGGLFMIPLRAYFQHRVRPETAGAALSANAILSFVLLCVITGAVMQAVPFPYEKEVSGNSAYWVVVLLGAITFLVTLFSMWILPDFALRFVIIALGNTFYKTGIRGAENIPERGGALLLANHVSFIDSILISACTSRRIRFLMHEDYFQVPFLSPIARITGFIRVPTAGKNRMTQMFEEVRTALRNGEIICVFPEGRMTRNGIMGRFKPGYERMLPNDLHLPVIPVCIGNVWGSIFSYFKGYVGFRMPREFPYCAMVSFGKQMEGNFTAFDVRQRIALLSAESRMNRVAKERTLHYLMLRAAGRTPFRVQLRDSNGKSETVLETVRTAILLSRSIRTEVSSDTAYVGILLPNSALEVIAVLSVLYADKTPAILNPTTTSAVFESSVRKASITHILTTHAFAEHCPLKSGVTLLYLDDLRTNIPRWKELLLSAAILALPYKELIALISPLSGDDVSGIALLLFSSGSTGNPKGIMLTHHNLYTNVTATAQLLGIEHGGHDHIVGNLPLFHSFGLNTGLWLPLVYGCEVTYVDNPLDAGKIGTVLDKYKPTILFATPSFLQIYLRKCAPELFRKLRLVITGAEKLRKDIRDKFASAVNNEKVIVEAYGCTELSPVVSLNFATRIVDLGTLPGKENSIGAAIDGLSAKVVDPLTHKSVPPGSEGLLFVKGPNVMNGYVGDPEQTSKVMFDGYYNTGDVVKMDERGYIMICGRLSRFSKIAGEMVPHEMVENIINEMVCREGRAVAVCGMPDPVKGEALLVLYTSDMHMTPAEVVAELRERSISNLWIPKVVNFHPVNALPMLGSGKLDLAALRRIAGTITQKDA